MNFRWRNCDRFKALSQTFAEVLINCKKKKRRVYRTSYSICELLHITFCLSNTDYKYRYVVVDIPNTLSQHIKTPINNVLCKTVKVKWSRYRPGVAQRVGTGIALLFHDHGITRGWVVSSTPRPHLTRGKDPVPILQEARWAPGPVWTGGKSRPYRDSIPDRPARSQSLYWLSYPAHSCVM